MELPEPAEAGVVNNLQQALLRAIQDQLQVSLDDEDAAAALVGSATLTTAVATRVHGEGARNTYEYTVAAWVPVALAGRALGGGGRRRALAAGAIPAALSGLAQSGYLLQRLHELGFDADALASSGALELRSGLLAPPSASPSPAGSSGDGGAVAPAASAALTPAAALGIAAAALALLLASAYGVYLYCAWERRATQRKRGAGDNGGASASIRAAGVILHLREEAGAASLGSPTSVNAASGRGFGAGADGGAPLAKQSIYADFDEPAAQDACVCCPPRPPLSFPCPQ